MGNGTGPIELDTKIVNIMKWFGAAIIVTGLITNSLILLIMSRTKIGSKYKRYHASLILIMN